MPTPISRENLPETIEEADFEPLFPIPQTEAPAPVTPISNTISLSSQEGVEKWFRIAFYDTLTNVVNDLNNQGSLSLSIFKDGKSYTIGSEEMVHDFGTIPNESFWELIIEMLEGEGLFAEEREGTIFVSWSN
jgi:hypothetical protein